MTTMVVIRIFFRIRNHFYNGKLDSDESGDGDVDDDASPRTR